MAKGELRIGPGGPMQGLSAGTAGSAIFAALQQAPPGATPRNAVLLRLAQRLQFSPPEMNPRETRMESKRESGFTLIEVMIAMLILGMGLLTLGLAQLSAMRSANTSESLSQAMYLAEQQLDAFYVTAPAVGGLTIDPLNPIDPDPADDDFTTYNRQWNVVLNAPQPGLSTITVQVTPVALDGGGLQAGAQAVTLQGVVGP